MLIVKLKQDKIRRICESIPSKCQFHLTRGKADLSDAQKSQNITSSNEKISKEIISDFMKPFQPKTTDTYICGPPAFIDKMKDYLLNLGCLEKSVFYEKWW